MLVAGQGKAGGVNQRIGIPTTYAGQNFRSRTEARWAALFDALGWRWVYEPWDERGWIPDFVVRLARMEFLVEVKGPAEDIELAKAKVDMTDYDGIVLVVGQDIDGHVVGEIREPDGPGFVWSQADVYKCLSCDEISIRPIDRDWYCRQCGDGEGNSHVGHYDIQDTFRRCSNRVQWRAE